MVPAPSERASTTPEGVVFRVDRMLEIESFDRLSP